MFTFALFTLVVCSAPAALSAAKPRYTNSWAVEVRGGAEAADALASKHGFINRGQVGSLRDLYHFTLATEENGGTVERSVRPAESRLTEKTQVLRLEENVGFVEQQLAKRQVKRGYTVPTDPNWQKQWSLLNTGQTNGPSGFDLNVEPAWIQGVTGKGVVVSFVDDGLERTHPDLSPNYDSSASWDFTNYDGDPTPDRCSFCDDEDSHGTSCAGEVGMARNNGHCGVGVAYDCNIGGLKVDLSDSSDLIETSALGYNSDHIQVYSNSWGPSDFGFLVTGPGVLVKRQLETGTTEGRNGKGSIYVWAAGNGGDYYDSCAADGYASSIYTIAIGSADQSGGQAFYDESCASKMAVTFSFNSDTFPDEEDDWDAYKQISTTTLDGACTDDFTGTSASTPLVSGVVALTLQANPDLTWRDVQYLIAYTSNPDILSGGTWTTNGAGLRVSHQFGFGAIDAEAMVTRARNWTNVPEQQSYAIQPNVLDSTAHNYDPMTVSFQILESSSNQISFLEHVVVTMSLTLGGYSTGYDYDDLFDYIDYYYYYKDKDQDSWPQDEADKQHETNDPLKHSLHNILKDSSERDLYDWLQDQHTKRGDIMIELTSPQGTKSTLLPYRDYDFVNEEGYENWPFMSVHYWGENPIGTWTLKVNFKSHSGYVHMSNLGVTIYGTAETPEAVRSIPSQCDSACSRGCSGPGPENCDACSNLRVASTLECVDQCPAGTYTFKKYCLMCDSTECQIDTDSPLSASPLSDSPLSDDQTYDDDSTSSQIDEDHDSHSGSSSNKVTIAVIGGVIPALLLIGLIIFIVTGVVCYCVRKRQHPQFSFVPLEEPKGPTTV